MSTCLRERVSCLDFQEIVFLIELGSVKFVEMCIENYSAFSIFI